MEYKDYYNIMGLSRDATQDEIKKAYRKLARKYHPDVSKEADAEQRFKEIGEAYEVLRDAQKRAAYDQLGSNWRAGQDFRPPPGWESHFDFGVGGGAGGAQFSDFFESLFGGLGGRHGRSGFSGFAAQGDDQHAKIRISLEDAYHGSNRSLQLQVPEYDAQGRSRMRARSLNVRIPKGIKAGQQIRLGGQGAPGRGGGANGDLYLEVEFEPHPLFEVKERDIYLHLPLTPWEAALGEKVTVPTLGGSVDMKVPAGSQSGKKMRLKGRGLPGNPPGDLYVEFQIITPPADSEQARQFYEQMAQLLPLNPRAHWG